MKTKNDNRFLLHIQYLYEKETPDNGLYEIDERDFNKAHDCVNRAYEAWRHGDTDDEDSFETKIEKEFAAAGVKYELVQNFATLVVQNFATLGYYCDL